MRRDGADHHEELGLKIFSCASQFTIPNTTGISPNPACNNTNTRSSQSYWASHTSDFSHPLIFFELFSSSSPISLFLIHNATIIAEFQVKSSLSVSACYDDELTLSTALLRGFLIPIINTTLIESSTMAYLKIFFFPRLILELNLLHR